MGRLGVPGQGPRNAGGAGAGLRAAPSVARRAAPGIPPRPSGGAVRTMLEPAFAFVLLPLPEKLKDNVDTYHSLFTELIVRTWPQAVVTKTSRKANAAGYCCAGARPRSAKGTDAVLKTWASRIHTAIRFANLVGRTVCITADGPRPSDAEVDRGVAKFFAYLNPSTLYVINRFLDARRLGYEVASGSGPAKEKTIKAYAAGLTHLFTRARVNGTTGTRVVPDCIGVKAPWQVKGLAEREKGAKEVRPDGGLFMGNPMHTNQVKSHKHSAEREARQAGEHSTTRGDVTPAMMQRLKDTLVSCHMAGDKMPSPSPDDQYAAAAPGTAASERQPGQQATPHMPAPDAAASRMVVEPDFLSYIFYAFLFVTLARPVYLLNFKHKDVSLLYPLVVVNEQFLHRYVSLWACCVTFSYLLLFMACSSRHVDFAETLFLTTCPTTYCCCFVRTSQSVICTS